MRLETFVEVYEPLVLPQYRHLTLLDDGKRLVMRCEKCRETVLLYDATANTIQAPNVEAVFDKVAAKHRHLPHEEVELEAPTGRSRRFQ